MKRPPAHERFSNLLAAAVLVFGRVGYRRAQIADIAREIGVAPGTVYLYVESKEALFAQALRCAAGHPVEEQDFPIPTPTADQILEQVKEELVGSGFVQRIQRITEGPLPEDVRSEFASLLDELYRLVYQRRKALQIIERSALEWPDLSRLFYGLRQTLLENLTRYLTKRMQEQRLRAAPSPPATARLIIETISWFAYHREGDPAPDGISEEMAQTTVLDALLHAYIPADRANEPERSRGKL